MTVTEARQILFGLKKEVNGSPAFGDAEVYYSNRETGKTVIEGYIGSRLVNSSININGVEFTGRDAEAIMK